MKNNYARKVALGLSTYSEVEWTKINHEVKAVAKRGLSSREREICSNCGRRSAVASQCHEIQKPNFSAVRRFDLFWR
jgi:hypothetical protein